MVEDGAELIVDRFEIYGRKGFSVFVLVIHKLVLPCDDLLGGDVAHLQFTEVRQQLGTDDMLLGCPCVFLNAGLHICRVLLHEALESHIQIGSRFIELFTLPSLCFTLGLKTTLLCLLLFTRPIGVAINHSPSACFFFFINCHLITSFPFRCSRTFP